MSAHRVAYEPGDSDSGMFGGNAARFLEGGKAAAFEREHAARGRAPRRA